MGIILKTKHLFYVIMFALVLVAFACTILLSGCASTKHKPRVRLPEDIPSAWQAGINDDQKFPITSSLIDLIGEEQLLRQLIDEAMENNPNLKATALRLKAAGYMTSTQRSRLLPQINAEFSKGRNNQGINMDGVNVETDMQTTTDSHQLSLGMSWELDIWGRLANEYAASKQAVFAQECEYLHIRDALAARVIQAWIEQITIRRSLSIEKERVTVLQRIEIVLVERYKCGLGNLDELSTAKSRTEIAKADLSALNASLFQATRKLEVLLGRYPRGELFSDADLPVIIPPPVTTPATVLFNRPDIQAALARMESAVNLSNAADKAILPNLSLSGQVFKQAANLNSLGSATGYWSILGSLFQPLFEGGRIIGEARARRTEADAALMELHEAVLNALKEVEDAFGNERNLAAQSQALKIAAHESEKSSRYYEERYRQGLDTIQSLLSAREQEMSVRIRRNEVMAGRLANRVDLALALGVGLNNESAISVGDRTP